MPRRLLCLTLFTILFAYSSWIAVASDPVAKTEVIGKLASGEEVHQFTLRNRNGVQARIMEYGATLIELLIPDRDGKFENVVLGSNSLESYTKGFPAASVIGRYANRIHQAKFSIDGKEFMITKNSGGNHIHGGKNNFAKVLWKGVAEVQAEGTIAKLRYTSPDGEEGFPGTLNVTVTYRLTDKNELTIHYQAKTDKPTILNLTNHAYFNLAGTGNVHDHDLQLMASTYTEADQALIPTGKISSVVGTPLDFLTPHRIGERIEKLEATRGYDHNFIVDGEPGRLRMAAIVTEPKSGRVMECLTTEPGVQLYTANGFNGNPFPKHGAYCLETQHYPDSPNRPEFPTTIVRPSDDWSSTTTYRFTIRK